MDNSIIQRHYASESQVERVAEKILCLGLADETFECEDARQLRIGEAVAAARATHGLSEEQVAFLRGILRDAIPRVTQ